MTSQTQLDIAPPDPKHMLDRLLEAAAHELTATQARMQELERELDALRKDLTKKRERRDLVQKLIALDAGQEPMPSPFESAGAGNDLTLSTPTGQMIVEFKKQSCSDLENAVAGYLGQVGRPEHVSTIRQWLLSNGVPIPGQGVEANILVRLNRAPETFVRVARGTYALADWKLPVAAMQKRRRRRRRRSLET